MYVKIAATKFVLEWITENLASLYGVEDVVYTGKTKYQKVDIIKTSEFGLALLLDGLLQSAEVDEFVYHESLVHPAMIAHPNPKRVLIVGGGEGATAREVERYKSVEEVQMVDLDGELIEIVKKYLPWSQEGFKDPRLKLVIAEGRSYLSSQPDGYYDVIIMDATDPAEDSLAIQLYTKEFYELAYRKLSENGLIVTHSAPLLMKTRLVLSVLETMKSVFPKTGLYAVYIKSLEAMWSFVVGSKGPLPSELSGEEVDRRLRERGVKGLKFYSGALHEAVHRLTDIYLGVFREKGEVFTDSKFAKTLREAAEE
ncbi:MAG: polyamine aminopropyltransferase [Thaumarchaeota archaeon]|nr:polyamine aminopropyltransferase [Nitrososphaerota archaeon]